MEQAFNMFDHVTEFFYKKDSNGFIDRSELENIMGVVDDEMWK